MFSLTPEVPQESADCPVSSIRPSRISWAFLTPVLELQVSSGRRRPGAMPLPVAETVRNTNTVSQEVENPSFRGTSPSEGVSHLVVGCPRVSF